MNNDTEFRNALPGEVADQPDSGRPRQLRTQADGMVPLTYREAQAAGLTVAPDVVYGESDEDPNRDDQIDEHRGSDSRP